MRLDKERQDRLEPKRIKTAKKEIEALGYKITKQTDTHIEFTYRGSIIKYFAYSGWATGKTIQDGRGLKNLIKQIRVDCYKSEITIITGTIKHLEFELSLMDNKKCNRASQDNVKKLYRAEYRRRGEIRNKNKLQRFNKNSRRG